MRPADLAVTGLVRPGDRVDVLAAGGEGAAAEPVAEGALVLAVPRAASGSPTTAPDGPAGLLVVAVDRGTAARLAAAEAGATLTVTLARP